MKTRHQIEFGDFQTPSDLAVDACRVLKRLRVKAASIVEPTCGVGRFLAAAVNAFPDCQHALGADVNAEHLKQAKRLEAFSNAKVQLREVDFFQTDWDADLAKLPDPLLIVGNPPWVCNSELGVIGGSNLPSKSNASKSRGIEAITGKSNFDVSEWMILRLLSATRNRRATIAMLCKTSVARKVLQQAWQNQLPVGRASIHHIDAQQTFGVSVDACLLTIHLNQKTTGRECDVYKSLDATSSSSRIGTRDGRLIANATFYDQNQSLFVGSPLRWRSGIKHDCAKVMELRVTGGQLHNGYGDIVDIEPTYLYPMLKSSNLATGKLATPSRWMLVPQQTTGEDTNGIEQTAPKTWQYLQTHSSRLNRRASSIYQRKPAFSIFGVGSYTFAPWKVAISGLYKKLHFSVVGSHHQKPIVLDDTCYSIPFDSKSQAMNCCNALNSEVGKAAFESLIFWDSKRPVTADVLNCVDFSRLVHAESKKHAA